MYNMTMTGGLGLLSISTEGDQQWTAEISNITHTMRLSLQADCGDAGQVLSSRLEYEETRLEMQGLDRSTRRSPSLCVISVSSASNMVLERVLRVLLSTANSSLETFISSWLSGALQSILC